MYARVARWDGADGDALRRSGADLAERAPTGPPPGVPARGFLMLIDPDGGSSLAIALFETEEDLRQGDAALNAMDPRTDLGNVGTRTSVETYEVSVDLRV